MNDDLPAREMSSNSTYQPCMCHNCDLVKAGVLKARVEMDEEAAMRKFKEFWDRPFADKDQDTLRAVLDAAWGPAKKIET